MLPYPKITQQGCAESKINEHWGPNNYGTLYYDPIEKHFLPISLKAVDTIGTQNKY